MYFIRLCGSHFLSPDVSSEVLMVEVIKSNVSQPKILWSNWV